MFKATVRQFLNLIMKIPPIRGVLRLASSFHLLPGFLWFRLPVSFNVSVSLPNRNRQESKFIYPSIREDMIGRGMYWEGWGSFGASGSSFYELSKQANLVIDVGANTGIYSLVALAANPSVRVLGLEPVPHVYERLTHNIRVNGWLDRCQLINKAAGNFNGHAKFLVPPGDLPGDGRVIQNESDGNDGGILIDTEVVTLDTLVSDRKSVDLVKIDVEGFEPFVLEGMREILSQSLPAVNLEVLPGGPAKEIEEILRPFGYRFFLLSKTVPLPKESIVPDPNQIYRNYLCLPEKWIKYLGL